MNLNQLLAEVERLGKLDCDGRGMPCMAVSRDLAARLKKAADRLRELSPVEGGHPCAGICSACLNRNERILREIEEPPTK